MGYLLTKVEDKGPCIKPKRLEKLFSMFNSRCSSFFKTEGIGLGLSTARILTSALQGAIYLNSKPDLGTEVGFSVLTQKEPSTIDSKKLKLWLRSQQHELEFKDLNHDY